MPRITLFIGVLLAFLGMAFFLYTNSEHPTALIPAGFGTVFMLLGLLAAVEHLRKHMMHAAAGLAALGSIFGIVRVILALSRGTATGSAFVETAVFAVLCGLLLLLCVKSFVDARRRRRQQAGEPGA